MRLAVEAGWARYDRRRAAGSKHRYGWAGDRSVVTEITSIAAEIVVSRLIGHDWQDTPEPDHDGDCGPGVQCRWTKYPNGCLIVHPGDEDDHIFYLVTGDFPRLTIRGWLYGYEAKQDEHWGELQPGRPAFNVPQFALRHGQAAEAAA